MARFDSIQAFYAAGAAICAKGVFKVVFSTTLLVQMDKKTIKDWFKIVNQADIPEVYIYGYIGPWDEVDFPTFQANIRELAKTYKAIKIKIHSGGGSCFEGLPIYDCLVSCGMEREVEIDGMAASMAGVISQAASKGKRGIKKNGTIMIHRVKGSSWGDAEDLRTYADMVEDTEDRIKEIFVESTGQESKIVDEWFARKTDFWINAKQALELGLVDYIIDNTESPDPLPVNKLQKMGEQKAYEALTNALENPNDNNKNSDSNMNKLQILVMAALAARGIQVVENATEEQVAAHVTNALKASDDKATELQNKITTIKGEQADALVNAAFNAGKITEEEKAEYKELAISNYALAAKTLNKIAGKVTPPKNVVVNVTTTDTGKKDQKDPENREHWTFNDYRKKDPKALDKMRDENEEEWQSLYNAEYKK